VRLRNAALFVLLFSLTPLAGQEEPLPPVTPRIAAQPEVMLVALASEPIRDYHGPTLAGAARNNDFVSFDALYREAKQRGENVAAFEALHELWTYNMTDPIGAFYGADMYQRLSRAYPGFAAFIADHAIVDNNGNTFYPTAETREFVLARALEGKTAPRVLIAEERLGAAKSAPVREARTNGGRTNDGLTNAARANDGRADDGRTDEGLRARRSSVAPVVKKGVAAPAPVVAEAAPVVVAETTPAPAIEVKEPVAIPEAAPVVSAEQQPLQPPAGVTETAAAQQPLVNASATSRGILLIVIGLIGIGLLAVMFRTPKETVPPSSVTTTVKPVEPSAAKQEEAKPAAPVEQIRPRTGGRASGSRG
jgi:hypothetical protein